MIIPFALMPNRRHRHSPIECTLSRAQITFEPEIVGAIEVRVCLPCEADLISHLRRRCAFASRLGSPAITLSAGT